MYWLVKKLIKISSSRSKRKILNYVLASEVESYLFQKLARYGFCPQTIIDVGAYEGEWTQKIKKFFPSAEVLMIEALPKNTYLEKIQRELEGVSFCIELLGSQTGLQKTFFECETGSSYYEENSSVEKTPTVRQTKTLDDVLQEKRFVLRHPSLLKIDAQGAELDILDGARKNLAFFEFIYLELPVVRYNLMAPDLEAYIRYMAAAGYRLWDISTHHISKDLLLQVDLLFVKKDSSMEKQFELALAKKP